MSWSGLPVCFYYRDGMTPERTLHTAQGSQPLERETTQDSSWWCVDDRMGLVQFGGSPSMRVEREVGFNWARQPEYRDESDTVYVSPLPEQPLRAGETALQHGAVLYTDSTSEQIARAADAMRNASLTLPEGWYGSFVPDARKGVKRFLAVANFDGDTTQASLELSTDLGAPVFQVPTTIVGDSGRITLNLEPLKSFGGSCPMFLRTEKYLPVQINPVSASAYSIEPIGRDTATVSVHVIADDIQSVRFLDRMGTLLEEMPVIEERFKTGIAFVVRQPVLLELVGEEVDAIGPAVEIRDLHVREDGQANVEVYAADASGIASVELFCDGTSLGSREAPPYIWHHTPEEGYHTFHATAADAAPGVTSRDSFKRTIYVAKAKATR